MACDRRLVRQHLNGLVILVVPIAAWTGALSVWVILAVLPLVTFVNQFVYPAQNAGSGQLRPPKRLSGRCAANGLEACLPSSQPWSING